jgi:DNA-binding CsgD family transcriptional regulator
MARPRKNKPRGQDERGLSTEHQVLELRKQGLTFAAIGARLGITEQGAHQAGKRALEKLGAVTKDEAEELRRLEIERLDALQEGLWPKAAQGSVPAVQTVLKLMERRARLLGLDAPQKLAVGGPDGGPIPIADARAVFAAAVARIVAEPDPGAAGPAPSDPSA